MKKYLFVFYFLVMPIVAMAYDDTDKIVANDVDKKINWSLAALSDVLRDLYHHHCKTSQMELHELSDYIYKKNPTATLAEIKDACLNQTDKLKPLFYYDTKNGECPQDGESKSGYVQKSGKAVRKSSCQYYMELLTNKQNEYVEKYGDIIDNGSGLFVKKVSDKFGGTYQIIDFVSNSSGNNNKANVYVVDDAGDIKNIKRKIRYGKLAVNIQTAGYSMGINEKSYIFPNYDVTNLMLHLCRQNNIPATMLVSQAPELKGSLTLDVKQMFCGNREGRDDWFTWIADTFGSDVDWGKIGSMRYDNQTVEQCHSNMVVFQNELVSFDYLGHWLFGCMRTVNAGTGVLSEGINKFYDLFAGADQKSDSGKAKGQAQDDGVLKAYQDEGSQDAKEMLYFYNTQTSTPQEAIELVKKHLLEKKFVNSKSDITECKTSECKKFFGQQDYVYCRIKSGKIYQYEFDDICD